MEDGGGMSSGAGGKRKGGGKKEGLWTPSTFRVKQLDSYGRGEKTYHSEGKRVNEGSWGLYQKRLSWTKKVSQRWRLDTKKMKKKTSCPTGQAEEDRRSCADRGIRAWNFRLERES